MKRKIKIALFTCCIWFVGNVRNVHRLVLNIKRIGIYQRAYEYVNDRRTAEGIRIISNGEMRVKTCLGNNLLTIRNLKKKRFLLFIQISRRPLRRLRGSFTRTPAPGPNSGVQLPRRNFKYVCVKSPNRRLYEQSKIEIIITIYNCLNRVLTAIHLLINRLRGRESISLFFFKQRFRRLITH